MCRTGSGHLRDDDTLLSGRLASEDDRPVYPEEGPDRMPRLNDWAICAGCTVEGLSTTECWLRHQHGERALYRRRSNRRFQTADDYEGE